MQAAATSEIRTGRHIQLDWPLHLLTYPGFGRKEFEHKVISLRDGLDTYGFDDELHINTQSGSQWDSLKHVSITVPFSPFSDRLVLSGKVALTLLPSMQPKKKLSSITG